MVNVRSHLAYKDVRMETKQLKGVILSVEDTLLFRIDPANADYNEIDDTEITKLFNFFKSKGIKPVLLANQRRWVITPQGKVDLYDYLEKTFDDLIIFTRIRDGRVPYKKTPDATKYVLNQMGWEPNETIYIGSSKDDMITALHGGILFLRATWYADHEDCAEYGFKFSEPKEVARFIDTLCLREHFWSHVIQDDDFEYYALAPYATKVERFAKYSRNGFAAAKFDGGGTLDFWLGATVTSLYFTGIYQRVKFIAPYPSHSEGVDSDVMSSDLLTFTHCFSHTKYLHNLIERHKTAKKCAFARARGEFIDHHNQLNTIKLNKFPIWNYKNQYKTKQIKKGTTVLLVDDICTKGWSLDAAKKYVEAAGAKAILVTWMKTINTNISTIGDMPVFNPFEENEFEGIPQGKTYNYNDFHVDHDASDELGDQLDSYLAWDWPQ